MRQEDPMPTQLEYGISRAACVRELVKRMYHGHFHYFTGPKSYYPDKVLDSPPPPNPSVSLIEDQMEKLSLSDTNELRVFASSFGKSVRQPTVRDKSKEDTGQLPYAIPFSLQQREPGSNVTTSTLLQGDTQQVLCQQSVLHCEILFKAGEVVAVKHDRRRGKWGFFLALLLKDLLAEDRTANELQVTENVMDIMWLDNSETEDVFLFKEAYEDHRNSPYSIVDRVCVAITSNENDSKCYQLSQEEVDRIERILKGESNSDIESDEESRESEVASASRDDHPRRVACNRRSGRTATRLSLN